MELNGKRAIVVGGASGMALASVELLIRNGVKVAILDLPTSRGAEEAARLGIRFYPCNVMDFAGIPRQRIRKRVARQCVVSRAAHDILKHTGSI